jgi:hypothetical protein
MGEFITKEKIIRVKNAVAAGTSAITDATAVDMASFDSCEFLVLLGTMTSTTDVDVTVYASNDSGGSPDDWTALTGATVAVPDTNSNKVVRIEVSNPAKRYLQVRLTRATANCVIDGILAIQRGASYTPITDDTTVVSGSFTVQPAEV